MIRRDVAEVADIIDKFLNGTGDERSWDDFVSIPIKDPSLDKIRLECLRLPDQYPPERSGKYCNEDGIRELRALIEKLR